MGVLKQLQQLLLVSAVGVVANGAYASMEAKADTAPRGMAFGSSGFNEMLGEKLASGALKTEALPGGGFNLSNTLQSLQAQVTPQGILFNSTSKVENKGGSFSLNLVQLGREGSLYAAGSSSLYARDDVVYHAHASGIAEKVSNTVNGIQQDFIVAVKPAGNGDLRVQLAVKGATLGEKGDGFTVSLDNSQRTLTYDRLKVTDADNKTIPAHMELLANNSISIVVEDAAAQYPLTIDPTVGDSNWVSMGGYNGVDGTVNALATSGSNVYAAGSFTNAGSASRNASGVQGRNSVT